MPIYKAYLKSNTRKHVRVEAESEIDAIVSAGSSLGVKLDSDIILIEQRQLKCPKCSYSWRFGGFRKLYATCPQCMKQILIKEASK